MSVGACGDVVREYLRYLGGEFRCGQDGDRLWIVSPYSYPDGDLVEIAVIDDTTGLFHVSDLGETLRHLSSQGFDPRSTQNGEYLLAELLKDRELELDRGMISTHAVAADVGKAIQAVLLACLAVSHLIFLSRGSRPATFVEEVGHLLAAEQVRYEPRYREIGLSGTKYDFDYFVHGRNRDGLVLALSPSSTAAATGMVNASFRKWADIRNGRWHWTILDDRLVTWRQNDLSLLRNVSDVHRWSDADKLRQIFSAA